MLVCLRPSQRAGRSANQDRHRPLPHRLMTKPSSYLDAQRRCRSGKPHGFGVRQPLQQRHSKCSSEAVACSEAAGGGGGWVRREETMGVCFG